MLATMKVPADLLLLPHWVVPVESEGALAAHAVVVQDGRILDVLPAEARLPYAAARRSTCPAAAVPASQPAPCAMSDARLPTTCRW
jgi:5-methylthioadenosine/S-adenosylhomocysteine deaminase